MIKMLIVDDELKTRNGLLKHINWNIIGIDMIQSAANGLEALKICQDFQPDIILSDIRMLGMNGIELCEKIRSLYPCSKIIFISGYSDKEYLKAAIRLGAIDYVEKPINPLQLKNIIQKIVPDIRKLKLSQSINSEGFIKHLQKNVILNLISENKEEGLQNNIEVTGIFHENYSCMRICILHTSAPVLNINSFWDTLPLIKNNSKANLNIYSCFKNNRDIILLLYGEEFAIADNSYYISSLKETVSHYYTNEIKLFLSVGKLVNENEELPSSYESALFALQTIPFNDYNSTVYYNEVVSKAIAPFNSALFNEFSERLAVYDESGAQLILQTVYDFLFRTKPLNIGYIQHIYYSLNQAVDYELNHTFQNNHNPERFNTNELEILDTINSMHLFLLKRVSDLVKNQKHNVIKNAALNRVIQYITEHYYDKNLSINKLAKCAYLTPTYLSALFKHTTGKTISEYITEVRIEHSKVLLRDNQYKMSQIANDVGYEDANYFAKIFKKYEEITPSEYRERNLL